MELNKRKWGERRGRGYNCPLMEDNPPPSAPPSFPVRLLFSASTASLAVCFGAAAWGLLAHFSNSVYPVVAFLIGWVVAVAVILPLRPVRGRFAIFLLPAAVLGALLSMFLGTVLFSTLYEIGNFESSAGEALADSVRHIGNFFASPEINLSFALSGIGGVLGFFNSWRGESPAGKR